MIDKILRRFEKKFGEYSLPDGLRAFLRKALEEQEQKWLKGHIKAVDEYNAKVKCLRLSEEEVAEYAHNAWSGWIKYMFDRGHLFIEGGLLISPEDYERWMRQANTAYKDLPEEEKESDRKEARIICQLQEGK